MSTPLPDGWFVLGDYVCEEIKACNCGMGEMAAYYGHEQYCGIEPVMTVAEWNERSQADDQRT